MFGGFVRKKEGGEGARYDSGGVSCLWVWERFWGGGRLSTGIVHDLSADYRDTLQFYALEEFFDNLSSDFSLGRSGSEWY